MVVCRVGRRVVTGGVRKERRRRGRGEVVATKF